MGTAVEIGPGLHRWTAWHEEWREDVGSVAVETRDGLVFIDPKDKAYLSITARAEVRHDHAKAAEIWKSTDDMWWKGPDDPNVCVLRVRPLTAELWDGPASTAVAAFEFAKARITGQEPNLGENRKVTVKM